MVCIAAASTTAGPAAALARADKVLGHGERAREALKSNSVLTTLDITGNFIGDAAVLDTIKAELANPGCQHECCRSRSPGAAAKLAKIKVACKEEPRIGEPAHLRHVGDF